MKSERQGDKNYDVVIVGTGPSGAIIAKELSEAGKRVLMLEAGAGMSAKDYDASLASFYQALIKGPNSPYPNEPAAPQPMITDVRPVTTSPLADGYIVYKGPYAFPSTYTRDQGGTSLHWMGTCLRFAPNDFRMRSVYGVGVDWPIGYEDLKPYYRMAERELGVAAEVEDQSFYGIDFEPGYVYPMHRIPPTYLDRCLAERIGDMTVEIDGETYPIWVASVPQGRNARPNARYDGGRGYQPVGAVGDPTSGQRCEGNSNCVPICPVQAKYTALKTLAKLDPDKVSIETCAVVSFFDFDSETGRIERLHYKRYQPGTTDFQDESVTATTYVLAANAIENAKIMLASRVPDSSGLVGANLMDQVTVLTWGLMPEPVGPYRGPNATSGIPTLRDGPFRARRAAVKIEIGNLGWTWPKGDPFTGVNSLIDEANLFGDALFDKIRSTYPRQFRFALEAEMLPDRSNRVTIDPAYRDAIGNYRPVVSYDVDDYTKRGLETACDVSDQIFRRIGAENHTSYSPGDPGYYVFNGKGFSFQGTGHVVGTHCMGTDPRTSVVDPWQRCHDHPNLYLAGCGSFPTLSTANPTLTMAALCFMTAENIKAGET